MDSKQQENYQPESSEELADVRLQQAHSHHQELVELLDTLIESNSKQGLEDFFDILIEQNAQLTKALTEKDDQAVIDAIKSIDTTEKLSEVKNAIVEALNKETEKDDNQLVKIITELVTELKNKPKEDTVVKVEVQNEKEVVFPDKFKVEVTNQVKIPEFPKSIDITQPKWYSAFSYDKLKESLKSVLESITLKIKSEKPLEVNILDSKGKIIDDFSPIIRQNINSGGGSSGGTGGGVDPVGIKNASNTKINPATEETQQQVLTAIQAIGGSGQPVENLALSYLLNIGNLISGTIASTYQIDSVYLILGEDSSTGLESDFNFVISGGQKADTVNVVGSYRGGAGHWIDVFAYNYTTLGFDQISTAINRLNNQSSDGTYTFTLTPDHTDANGNCKIRFKHSVSTYNSGHRLYIDHLSASYSLAGATKIQDTDNVLINPSTKENQALEIAELQAIKTAVQNPPAPPAPEGASLETTQLEVLDEIEDIDREIDKLLQFFENVAKEPDSGETLEIDTNMRQVFGTERLVENRKLNVNPLPEYYVSRKNLPLIAGAVAMIDVTNFSSLAVQISGTWTGTLTFEASVDGGSFQPISGAGISTSGLQTTTTVNTIVRFNVVGLTRFQVRFTTATTGSPALLLVSSTEQAFINHQQVQGSQSQPLQQRATTFELNTYDTNLAVALGTSALFSTQAQPVMVAPVSPTLPTGGVNNFLVNWFPQIFQRLRVESAGDKRVAFSQEENTWKQRVTDDLNRQILQDILRQLEILNNFTYQQLERNGHANLKVPEGFKEE